MSAESEKVHRLVLPLNMVVRDCVYLCLSDETLKAVGIGMGLGCYANRAVENSNLFRKIAQNTTEKDISTTG